ncbi:hypothetical protein A2617_01970 [Candidatus Daviesbacteria bacterium RIFOXYD1_FULL_41_10]|uniref:Uncharacterized protein n=2 Tax=Candidatus Daviesiibacteriota TaxID=1752718 RepID=A0A1F5N0Y6_9BACT|nr:MAG: hypothetical protein UU67_C0002G0022 [Candidatus Daviesbacteria bacterium GW2011_GWB1_41_5]OGE71271.1 MAG: hypothetical protein A2617_01970 [Candidatus Daviesbacteria bacterium RIFOXYD1_FULL_41_10]
MVIEAKRDAQETTSEDFQIGQWEPEPRILLPGALKRLARHTRLSPGAVRMLMQTRPQEKLIEDLKIYWKEQRQARRRSRT